MPDTISMVHLKKYWNTTQLLINRRLIELCLWMGVVTKLGLILTVHLRPTFWAAGKQSHRRQHEFIYTRNVRWRRLQDCKQPWQYRRPPDTSKSTLIILLPPSRNPQHHYASHPRPWLSTFMQARRSARKGGARLSTSSHMSTSLWRRAHPIL